ncbi:MAG: hypothetical protein LBB20_01920 [Puniceicoccales bacterium]|nr:hypothetical protein [Puniceicoccales bacterium]
MSLVYTDCRGYFIEIGKWTGAYGDSPLARHLNFTLYDVTGGGWGGCGYYAIALGLNPSIGRCSRTDALAIRKIVYPNLSDDTDCYSSNSGLNSSSFCCGKIAKQLGVTLAISGLKDSNNQDSIIVYDKNDIGAVYTSVRTLNFTGRPVILIHHIPSNGTVSGRPHWIVGLPNNLGRVSNKFEVILPPGYFPRPVASRYSYSGKSGSSSYLIMQRSRSHGKVNARFRKSRRVRKFIAKRRTRKKRRISRKKRRTNKKRKILIRHRSRFPKRIIR